MRKFVRELLNRRYNPLNRIEVFADNLVGNYQTLSRINPKIRIAPVLKSNAYGHGLTLVAKVLDPLRPPFLCVDSLYEAYELLKAGIKSPILIMGYVLPENLKTKRLPFWHAVYAFEQIEALNHYQKGAQVHLFVDTGMNREGVKVEELEPFLKKLKTFPDVQVDGLMSHLAMAELPEDPLTLQQVENFSKAKELCRKYGLRPRWYHFTASSGFIKRGEEAGNLCNVSRAGLALYGLCDSLQTLKPALRLISKIIQSKEVKKGERIGYDGTYYCQKPIKLGVLPLGYFEGVDRRLSNKGVVLVDGAKCPIVGRVSMNLTTIDLSLVKKPFVGQEVIVYSNKKEDDNCLLKCANLCETIPYDLLVHLDPSIRREVVSLVYSSVTGHSL